MSERAVDPQEPRDNLLDRLLAVADHRPGIDLTVNRSIPKDQEVKLILGVGPVASNAALMNMSLLPARSR
jgi:hypothetical protein